MATILSSEIPVLATIAPPLENDVPETLNSADEFPGPVVGWPVYDHMGYLYHKRFLWRKRFVAIQGRHLLYFMDAQTHDPKYIIDMSNVQLKVDSGSFIRNGDRNEWKWTAKVFSISGYGVPEEEREMHFQALDAADCERWCKAVRLAINGRCQRCTVSPAKYSGHKYCLECSRIRKKEKQQERHRQAIIRLRQLMGLPESSQNQHQQHQLDFAQSFGTNGHFAPLLAPTASPRVDSPGRDPMGLTVQLAAEESESADRVGSAWSSDTPSPRANLRGGRLEPLDFCPMDRLSSVTSVELDSPGRSAAASAAAAAGASSPRRLQPLDSPLPARSTTTTTTTISSSSESPRIAFSSESPRERASPSKRPVGPARRIPGLLPSEIAQLPRQRWGALVGSSGSSPINEDDADVDEHRGLCGICTRGFRTDCWVTMLGCDHLFHHECLVDWTVQQATCPCCLEPINVSEL